MGNENIVFDSKAKTYTIKIYGILQLDYLKMQYLIRGFKEAQ